MQKIIIQNFNQVKHAEIDLTKFVCLIGEQASGKSTIAKLIYFFKSLKAEFLKLFFEAPQDYTISNLRNNFLDSIKYKFLEYFGSLNHIDHKFEVKFFVSIENQYYIKLSKGTKGLSITFSPGYWKTFMQKAASLLKALQQAAIQKTPNYLLQSRINQGIVSRISSFANEMFSDPQETVFIPSGRCLITMLNNQIIELYYQQKSKESKESVEYPNILRRSIDITLVYEYIGYIGSVKNRLNNYDYRNEVIPKIFQEKIERIIKGKYVNEEGKERIYYNDTNFIPLNIASSGQQDSIGIILDALDIYRENFKATRIIEEPETHLFPTAQRHLVELIIAMCNLCNTSYIITTHSPFVLAALNNILYLNRYISKSDTTKIEKYVEYFEATNYKESFPRCYSVKKNDIRAYNLSSDNPKFCTSMIDEETGLIGTNLLDDSTEMIYGIFDHIYDEIE